MAWRSVDHFDIPSVSGVSELLSATGFKHFCFGLYHPLWMIQLDSVDVLWTETATKSGRAAAVVAVSAAGSHSEPRKPRMPGCNF